jgi:hypothetical protein
MVRGHVAGDERARRIADEVGLLDLEVVEEADHVGRHLRAVLLDFVRLVALAVPPAVEGNHHEPVLPLELRVAGPVPPPHAGIGHPAVDEDDGFPLPLRDIANLHAGGIKCFVGPEGGIGEKRAEDEDG